MSRKKTSTESKAAPTHFDFLIVGGGPAGQLAAREILSKDSQIQLLLLESAEGRAQRVFPGLHLVDAGQPPSSALLEGPTLGEARVRWERQWVKAAEVDWTDKEWISFTGTKNEVPAAIPQWNFYLHGEKKLLAGIGESAQPLPMRDRSPVSRIERLESKEWAVEVAGETLSCKTLIWAAGLSAFQNAYGKIEAQAFLGPNPAFEATAQDYRGGIALEIILDEPLVAEEAFVPGHVFALPVKHGGRRYLLIGAFFDEGEKTVLSTLTHLPPELLNDPKELISLQKSLRRGLKAVFSSLSEQDSEKLIVSPRVGGHVLGSPWLLRSDASQALFFIGDEAESGVQDKLSHSLGALASVNALIQDPALFGRLRQSPTKDPAEESSQVQTHTETPPDLSP